MRRLLKWTFGIALIAIGFWYLALKKDHYQISFTTKEPLGVVYNKISNWEKYNGDSAQKIIVVETEPYESIIQKITVADSSFLYQWELKKESNGKTKVTAKITDTQNPWTQKVQAPFKKNAFVQRSLTNVKSVGEALQIESKKFKVLSISDTLIAPSYCVYIPVSSSVNQKATSMLKTIAPIMEYIKGNNIPLKGDPFLEVTSWDEIDKTITYNFCFPIEKSDALAENKLIQFKTIEPFKALKATYNGNYRISDHAWHYLIEYAQKNKYYIKKLPFEIYLNDPHVGGDPLQWEAHILMPLD